MNLLLVALGALVGAPLRFWTERRLHSAYPWGTFVVNVVGSLVLGVLGGLLLAPTPPAHEWVLLVGVGFCGSLTTFGGFAAQVLDLALVPREVAGGQRAVRSAAYALATLVVCVGSAGLGFVSAAALTGGAA